MGAVDPSSDSRIVSGSTVWGWRLGAVLHQGPGGTAYQAASVSGNGSGTGTAVVQVIAMAGWSPAYAVRLEQRLGQVEDLAHPLVARILDSGPLQGGSYVVVMEAPAGGSIEALCQTGCPWPLAARIIRTIALALDQGWQRYRLIHGALEPAWILADHAGSELRNAVLLGLGLMPETRPTGGLEPFGTPENALLYRSPEQLLGDGTADHRSDQYALGAMLFHLVTGRPPFPGRPPMQTALAHLGEQAPDLRTTAPVTAGVPPTLAAVVARSLAKHLDDRFPDHQALAKALMDCIDGRDATARPLSTRLTAAPSVPGATTSRWAGPRVATSATTRPASGARIALEAGRPPSSGRMPVASSPSTGPDASPDANPTARFHTDLLRRPDQPAERPRTTGDTALVPRDPGQTGGEAMPPPGDGVSASQGISRPASGTHGTEHRPATVRTSQTTDLPIGLPTEPLSTKITLRIAPEPVVTAPSLEPGEVVDGYFRIDAHLANGAGSEVYLVYDQFAKRELALKILSERSQARPSAVRHFRAESAALVTLDSPFFPFHAGSGTFRGRDYLLMERVRGQDLDSLVASLGPMDEALALLVARQLAIAMDQAWTRCGVVHRDLKPANLMFADGDHQRLKVLDLGIATFLERSELDDFGGERLRLEEAENERSGGTPGYMAPEQIAGAAPTPAMDVHAFGATLYHLLSGRPPYQAPTAGALLALHQRGTIPDLPAGVVVGTSTKLLLRRSLAKRPEDRYASWPQVLQAIDGVSRTVRLNGPA